MGSRPSRKLTDTVLGATDTLTVLQSSLSVVSIILLMAELMTSMPPGLVTSMQPRYQALITFLGSSMGVGNVSLRPAMAAPAWIELGRVSLLDSLWSTDRLVGRAAVILSRLLSADISLSVSLLELCATAVNSACRSALGRRDPNVNAKRAGRTERVGERALRVGT